MNEESRYPSSQIASTYVYRSAQLAQSYRDVFVSLLEEFFPRMYPQVAVILVGDSLQSLSYIRAKQKALESLGGKLHLQRFLAGSPLSSIQVCIDELNRDEHISGILVQLPTEGIDSPRDLLDRVDPQKDVDGLSVANLGRFMSATGHYFVPCTALGIATILEDIFPSLDGRSIVILGRSLLVGRSTAQLLSSAPYNATLTLCHTKTRYLDVYTRRAEIVISAIGSPGFIKRSLVREGSTVIDVGLSFYEGRLCGDADAQDLLSWARLVTAVPGGVGPMTVTMLIYNVLKAFFYQKGFRGDFHRLVEERLPRRDFCRDFSTQGKTF